MRKNPSAEDAALPLTSKTDKKHHGIGLANIARCAKKYQGSIAVEIVPRENRQRFCLMVMLYDSITRSNIMTSSRV